MIEVFLFNDLFAGVAFRVCLSGHENWVTNIGGNASGTPLKKSRKFEINRIMLIGCGIEIKLTPYSVECLALIAIVKR